MKKDIDPNEYICHPCSYGNCYGKREEWVVPGFDHMLVCTCDCHVTSTTVVNFDKKDEREDPVTEFRNEAAAREDYDD